MTTIKDIAEYTGVSATTVSNVIHGKSNRVSAKTVQKIQDAIEELHYVPNLFARSLVSSSSKVIALVNYLPTRADAAFSDASFNMAFLSTIESILKTNGYYLMYRRLESIEDMTHFLQNWNVDGILLGGVFDNELLEAIEAVNVPVVLIDSYCGTDEVCEVCLDDDGGEYQVVKYLIDHGHKRIVFATSPMHDGYIMKERFKGYKTALKEAGIVYDSRLVIESDIDLKSCREVAEDIMKLPGVTAIAATTDVMAAGLITSLRELGVSIPKDISVVGFDDSDLSQLTMPPLTTIRQDLVERSSKAAELILQLLSGEEIAQKRIEFPTELIIRKSVKDIR